MEQRKWIDKLRSLGKLKYALLLSAVGICILLLPQKENDALPASAPVSYTLQEDDLAAQLEEILSAVDGAGEVKVVLSKKNDGATMYQTDTQSINDGNRVELRAETVFGKDSALVVSRTNPEYTGAVIVCQGGNNPSVCLALVDATSSLTGLTSDKITVLKMNESYGGM